MTKFGYGNMLRKNWYSLAANERFARMSTEARFESELKYILICCVQHLGLSVLAYKGSLHQTFYSLKIWCLYPFKP